MQPWEPWEPVQCNFGSLGNMYNGTLSEPWGNLEGTLREPLESNLGNLEGLMKRCSGRAKDAKSAKKVQKAFSRSRGYAFMAFDDQLVIAKGAQGIRCWSHLIMKKHWLVNGSCAGKAQKHKRNDLSEIHRRNLYNLTLGTLRKALQSNLEPLLGNLENRYNLTLGTLTNLYNTI